MVVDCSYVENSNLIYGIFVPKTIYVKTTGFQDDDDG